jgi:hypothetical protein
MRSRGLGSGSMAAAARLKPGPEGIGVEVDDYAEAPIELTTGTRTLRQTSAAEGAISSSEESRGSRRGGAGRATAT